MPYGGWSNNNLYNSYAYNCVITNPITLVEPSEIHNCMQFYGQYSLNMLFVGWSNDFYDSDFHLTDLINTFPGSDGSQVGIFGGAMPYNPRPSYLILNNTSVAGQSDVNGNLNVNIEIIEENK